MSQRSFFICSFNFRILQTDWYTYMYACAYNSSHPPFIFNLYYEYSEIPLDADTTSTTPVRCKAVEIFWPDYRSKFLFSISYLYVLCEKKKKRKFIRSMSYGICSCAHTRTRTLRSIMGVEWHVETNFSVKKKKNENKTDQHAFWYFLVFTESVYI